MTRILVVSGSLRPGSVNSSLAALFAQECSEAGAQVSTVSLADYPMPLYAAEIEAAGIPDNVHSLHAQFAAHDGIFITTPEYNAFPPPLLLNALDWMSRVRHYEGGMVEAFENPVFALGAASPSPVGGYRSLTFLRQKLSLGLGAFVVPAMIAVPGAYEAFAEDGAIQSDYHRAVLAKVVAQLLEKAGS